MGEIILTAEDQKVLTEANNLYLFDWRENDDDEATAGWRHPGYFMEVNKPFDFEKLVRMGLMERGGNPDYITYRISELGIAKVDELAPDPHPNALPSDGDVPVGDLVAARNAVNAVLVHQSDEAARYEAELAAARSRIAALEAQVSAYENVWLYTGWKAIADILDKAPIRDWETVYARALGFVIGKARQMAELQAAKAASAGEGGGGE